MTSGIEGTNRLIKAFETNEIEFLYVNNKENKPHKQNIATIGTTPTDENELQNIWDDIEDFSETSSGINFDDFETEINGNSKLERIISEFGIKEAFDTIDKNSDGVISDDEIKDISSDAVSFSDITAVQMQDFLKQAPANDKVDGSKAENAEDKVSNENSVEEKSDADLDEIREKLKNALGGGQDTFAANGYDNDPASSAPSYTAAPAALTDAYSAPSADSYAPSAASYTPSVASYAPTEASSTQSAASYTPSVSDTSAVNESESLDEQIEQLENVDIPQTEKELSDMKTKMETDVKEQQETQKKAIEESEEVSDELKEEYKGITDALSAAQEEKSNVENSKAEEESSLSDINANISEIDSQISAISTDTGDDEVDKQNKDKISDLKSRKESLEAEKKEIEAKIDDYNDKLKDIDAEIEKQEGLKEDVLKKIEDSLSEDSPLRKVIEETEEKIQTIKADYETQSGETQTKLDDQRAKLEELKTQKGKNEGKTNNFATGDFAKAYSENSNFKQGVLADKGAFIEEVCAKYGVDPYLATSIMVNETGWGTSNAIKNHNNPGGYMDSATNWSTIKTFDTLEDGIEAVVKNLSKNYLNQGRTTIASIGDKYCPVGAANDPTGLNSGWIPGVTKIYNELAGTNIDPYTDLGHK